MLSNFWSFLTIVIIWLIASQDVLASTYNIINKNTGGKRFFVLYSPYGFFTLTLESSNVAIMISPKYLSIKWDKDRLPQNYPIYTLYTVSLAGLFNIEFGLENCSWTRD